MSAGIPQQVLRLPPQRFYWAVLDSSALVGRSRSRSSPRRTQLGYLFENVLPIPIEQVHAVYQRLGDGRFIACGMAQEALRAELASAAENSPLVLTPQALPAFIKDDTDIDQLNLLVGDFEPAPLTERRRRWLMQVAAFLIACAALIAGGAQRRTAALHAAAAQLSQERVELITNALVSSGWGKGGSRLAPDLQLVAELRRLRQTRQEPAAELALPDMTLQLAELLSLWPPDVHVQAESIMLSSGSLVVRGIVPATSDVQRLVNALMPLEGWQIQQPQVTASRGSVNATIQFRRKENQS